MPRMAEEPEGVRPDLVTLGLLGVRIAVLVAIVVTASHTALVDDLARFREVATTPGSAYRDFPVEYAPLETLMILAIAKSSATAVITRVATLAFLADIAAWAAICVSWGRRPGTVYLWLGTPLLLFMYARFDFVTVALAVGSAALARRSYERAAGLSFGAAVMTKLWPMVILPGFWIERRLRSVVWGVGTVVVASVAWTVLAGPSAVSDVVTFRHATGWGVESSVGSVLWAFGDGEPRLEAGAPRIGHIPGWAGPTLTIILLFGLVLIWQRARTGRTEGFGGASAAAVGFLLVCSPLFSLQYAAWLLPWGAIAWTEDDRPTVSLVGAISILTALLFVAYDPARAGLSSALLVIRNALVLALPILWCIRSRRSSPVVPSER
jgi:Glycosyltransferase family 87